MSLPSSVQFALTLLVLIVVAGYFVSRPEGRDNKE